MSHATKILRFFVSMMLGLMIPRQDLAQDATVITGAKFNPECEGYNSLPRDLPYAAYLIGFFEASELYSGVRRQNSRSLDLDHIWTYVDTYCLAHPKDKLSTAAIAIFKSIYENKRLK